MPAVEVRVTKLSKAAGKQFFGGTYFVDESVANELVAGGHAEIITDGVTAEVPAKPIAPPFPATATSKKVTPVKKPKGEK